MQARAKGKYRVRLAKCEADLLATQRLRYLAFRDEQSSTENLENSDQDRFDPICDHVLVEDRHSGQLLCSFRMMSFSSGADIPSSYSAQFYDLTTLKYFRGPMVEIGRFCIHPQAQDPDLLRAAWAVITDFVDRNGVELLFGCSSFKGTDTLPYSDAFAVLRDKHVAPKRWLPKVKAPKVFDYVARAKAKGDPKKAMRLMPPLLRTYLLMGGWVSDHVVVDGQMNTLHLFTGVEIKTIPPARKRLLRTLSAALA